MELIYRQQYPIGASSVDCFGRAKPSVLLYLAQEVATEHCVQLGTDWDTLQKQNLFWALIRTHVQISQLPTIGQTLTLETWPMPQTRTAYPRCTVGYDKAGRECFRVTSLWVLMDTQNRAMVLPGKAQIDVPGIQREEPVTMPRALPPCQADQYEQRRVLFGELDRNMHMNNTKYLDWVMDLLDQQFHRSHQLREFSICYLSEALEGQMVDLSYSLNEAGILAVDGHRSKTDVHSKTDRIFAANLQFIPCSVNQ